MPNDDRAGSANPDGASAKGGVDTGSSVTINKPVDERRKKCPTLRYIFSLRLGEG
jgi:hypothetical protein